MKSSSVQMISKQESQDNQLKLIRAESGLDLNR